MSRSEWCRQVGRAGRDGGPASCHLFLDDADFLRLRSLAHSDGVDAPSIAAFLRAAFGEPPRDVRVLPSRVPVVLAAPYRPPLPHPSWRRSGPRSRHLQTSCEACRAVGLGQASPDPAPSWENVVRWQ